VSKLDHTLEPKPGGVRRLEVGMPLLIRRSEPEPGRPRSRMPGSAEERRAVRQAETKPLVEKLKAWLENRLGSAFRRSRRSILACA
jgi:hypothetical protein